MKCICCNNQGKYSVLLAVGSDGKSESPRYYIPNQTVRASLLQMPDMMGEVVHEVYFCHDCMRKVEDNLRATIAYLQTENASKGE
ncbi:MAG: hypothetical protein HND47_17905 [Chloroflexi bacterium]|nr:hypothetical protein [Chloroflexota bacterium]